VGTLFLADYSHRSPTNPRGWFNAPALDVTGPGGFERFHAALMAYASRAIGVLQILHAQGMIVWDLEGEEFPQKISYIGDPRALDRLAPEMAAAADEFFARFRDAGFRTGVTIRPQQLAFDADGHPRQDSLWNPGELLLSKIDYARRRWGVTLFYIDSTRGIFSPTELFTLAWVARQRPGILLVPEHHQPLYYGFSAPYNELRYGVSATPSLIRWIYPNAFQFLNIRGALRRTGDMSAALRSRDVLLFAAWYWNKDCDVVKQVTAQTPR
jgi:hypothetical protein